ncbi:hypothetical protein ACFV4F_41315 [Kitasatospora sp. NPDC059722]|uniref:hypothetical protein n=1 Tax=Kitasatospora sp. NPDC059722 TaxID=3346925 RepID=UPI00368E3EDD
MSFLTIRRAPAVRTLAGTVLSAALLVPAATACSSTSTVQGGATPSATPSATVATTPTASTSASAAAPASTPASASTGSPTGSPAAPPGAKHTTPPAAPGKGTSPAGGQTLPDGSKAEIQKLGELHYVAKIVHDGQVYGTLEANGHDAGVDANDMFVVLSMDGTVHAWMGGSHKGPGTFKLAGGWTAKVTKLGELHYRADILGLDGAVNGTFEADQHDAGLDANGVYIVLGIGGEISAHE